MALRLIRCYARVNRDPASMEAWIPYSVAWQRACAPVWKSVWRGGGKVLQVGGTSLCDETQEPGENHRTDRCDDDADDHAVVAGST